jgi:hypothetical protein
MSNKLDDALRGTFLALADALIPEAEGMPAASQVGVGGDILERMLALRPDLRDAFMRGLRAAAGKPAAEAAQALNRDDQAALGAIGLVAAIGYPGQESRPADPDATPEYVANGMLQQVIDRGPIFKPTPK